MNLGNNMYLPVGVRNLLIITVIVFILQMIPGVGTIIWGIGGLVPSLVFKKWQVWRLFTYMFLHGGPLHILFNMLALWMFGVEIEQMWGTKRFIIFYVIGGVGAGLLSFLMWNAFIIGASGAVLALLTVYAFYFPQRRILMFFILPVPVWLAVIIIGAISIVMAGQSGGVAHLTHLGGIIVALLYLKYYNQVISSITHIRAVKAEKKMRQRAENKIQKDHYFEEVVDPILKKISERGMDSLTKEERKKLNHYSDKS